MPIKGPPETGYTRKQLAEALKPLPFRPAAIVGTFAPVPELVEELEKLIDLARSGKLRAAAWAVVYHGDGKPDGSIGSGWTRGPYTAFGLTSAIEQLSYRWKKKENE